MGNCWSEKQLSFVKQPTAYVPPTPVAPYRYRWSKISEVSQETDAEKEMEPLSI
jgi:hypothetical protein